LSSLSVVEAFDLVALAAQLADRLETAKAQLAQKNGHRREKEWLDSAAELLATGKAERAELMQRAFRLDELAFLREEEAEARLGQWVDALEKLVAGITFHAGSRSPMFEALFPKQKIPSLRRAPKEQVEKYHKDFEKRLNGSYAKRMLGTDEFAFAGPVLEQVAGAYARWQEAFSPAPLAPEETESLTNELTHAAQKLELPIRQAKLVAEAALAPVHGAFEASGLNLKLKKRAAKPAHVPEAPKVEEAPAPEPEPAPVEAAAPAKPKKKKRAAESPAVTPTA
jgi:hypothetical protein